MMGTMLHSVALRGAGCLVGVGALAAASAFAQAVAAPQPTVSVTASATATVANDRIQAWLQGEAENASASAAASQVNAAIAKALDTAKGYPSIKVSTAGYWTQQASDKVKAQRWRVVQVIHLEGSDFTAAAALISRLQDDNGLLLSGMSFTLAEKTRRDAEDSVTQQAIQLWQTRAQQAARALGFAAWKPGHVTVQTGDGGRVYPAPRLAMATAATNAPVNVEGGTTDVTVTVSGDALLQ